MKYIIQIHTGYINLKKYDTNLIIDKLDEITNKINISKAIIGWNPDYKQNKILLDYLKNKNIETYFWLPVFAEIIDKNYEDINVSTTFFNEGDKSFAQNDKFDFVCQSSSKNIDYIIDKYNTLAKDLKFDGVFLDRIRYQSPTVDKDALFGCMCNRCKNIYKENNIDINKFNNSIYDKLKPIKISDGVYSYNDLNIDKLMKVKRNIINDQVSKIYNYFKSRNMKLGIDAFALSLADFVGQDIISLSKVSDFIKPMFYLKTIAPAGVPYELRGLGNNISESINSLWNSDVCDISSTIKQLKYLEEYNTNICPGIDVNNIKDVCTSTTDYVLNYINEIKKTNTFEIVLSWDALQIDSNLLDKLKE